MKAILLTLTLLVCALELNAQAVRIDPQAAWTTASALNGSYPPILAIPSVSVTLCNYPANATVCTNFATTYSDATAQVVCPFAQQVTWPGGNTCVSYSNPSGAFGFWVLPGNYTYRITLVTGLSFGPYAISAGGGGGGSQTYPAANTLALSNSLGNGWVSSPTFSAITALWASGACGAGFLKGDGSCPTSAPIAIQQSGSALGTATTLNCTTNVTCSVSGGVASISAAGGGSGGPITTLQLNGVTVTNTGGTVNLQLASLVDGAGTHVVQTGSGDTATVREDLKNTITPATTNYSVTGSDCGGVVWDTAVGAITLTLPQPTLANTYIGCVVHVNSEQGGGTVTVTPTASTVINGSSMTQSPGARKCDFRILSASIWEQACAAN